MNNRFAQGETIRDAALREVLEEFGIVSGGNLGVNYDIRPTNPALAVIAAEKDSGYEGHAMRFGLWEPWMEGKRLSTFNARSETIESSRLYGPLWRKGRRCAIPSTGWYEWDGPKGAKRRWHFSTGEPDGFFWFGGLHNQYRDTDEDMARSMTLLTVPANKTVGAHHSTPKDPGGRMPVILDHGDVPRWLDSEADVSDLVETWPDGRTDCYEVPRQAVGMAQAMPIENERLI